MFLTKPSYLVFSTFLLASCASQTEIASNELFKHQITAEGAKYFQFYLIQKPTPLAHKQTLNHKNQDQKPSKGKSKERSQQRNVTKSPQNIHDKALQEWLDNRLTQTLADNQYCREGFILLERNVGKGLASIKGECHESASPEDRKKFISN